MPQGDPTVWTACPLATSEAMPMCSSDMNSGALAGAMMYRLSPGEVGAEGLRCHVGIEEFLEGDDLAVLQCCDVDEI